MSNRFYFLIANFLSQNFLRTTLIGFVCFVLNQGVLFIPQGVSKNLTDLSRHRQNKQSLPTPSSEKIRRFDYVDSIPEGYQPIPFSEENSEQFNSYRLNFGDAITVRVERFPEFNFAASLDASGDVVTPILGKISLRGLTMEEVETKISYELGRRFLQENPRVIAVISRQRPVTLTIMGEIFRPGYYTIRQGTPMSAVLRVAGGATSNADLRSIIVKRTLTDGTVLEEKLDLYTPLVRGQKEPRILLQGGDTVIISRLEVGEDRDYDRLLISRSTLPRPTITIRIVAPIQPAGVALRNVSIPSGSTFLDAVARLPTFVPLITREDVTLMRFDPELGRVVTQTLNVAETIEDGDLTQNIPLRDEDVIIVSRTILGKVLAGIRVLTQPIRDVLGFTNFINRFDRRF